MMLTTAGCAALPTSHRTAVSEELPSAQDSAFAGLASIEHDKTLSGFRMLSAGLDGLLVRLEIIEHARRSLDLQYYIFRGDNSGLLVADALLHAADRGVRIRVLVDDGETIVGDERILSLAAHANIEVRIFNPLRYRGHVRLIRGAEFLVDKRRLDYRMHNKQLIADGEVALTGGRNIGDQYFQIDPGFQFGDDDALAIGPIVPELTALFEEFWNSDMAVAAQDVDAAHTSIEALAATLRVIPQTLRPDSGSDSEFEQRRAIGQPLKSLLSGESALSWSTAELVHDSPDKKSVIAGRRPGSLMYRAWSERADTVSSELLMVTPYLVPTHDESDLLSRARARGVIVRMLTNSLASAPDIVAHAGYVHSRPHLLAQGVELHEVRALLGSARGSGESRQMSRYGNYALHAKLYVFDRSTVFIGSMNFDQRSRHLNTEMGLLINSTDIARQAAARFDALTALENAYWVTQSDEHGKKKLHWTIRENGIDTIVTREPARSRWQNIEVRSLSWLPIEPEL